MELRRRARLQKPNRTLNRESGKPTEGEKGQKATALLDLEEREGQAEETGREGTAQEAKTSIKSKNEMWQPASQWGGDKTRQAWLAGARKKPALHLVPQGHSLGKKTSAAR